jgi:DNA-directed RNA polymerase subunit RPC12/RpoP
MALQEIDAACTSCGTQFRAKPTRSFLGFQRLTCPNCAHEVLYPLTPGYRITYWAILALMIVGAIVNLAEGAIPIPGLLGIAVVIGIVKDVQIRKRIAVASAR